MDAEAVLEISGLRFLGCGRLHLREKSRSRGRVRAHPSGDGRRCFSTARAERDGRGRRVPQPGSARAGRSELVRVGGAGPEGQGCGQDPVDHGGARAVAGIASAGVGGEG